MVSAYAFEYVVQDSDGPLEYPAGSCKIYQPGESIWVSHTDKMCFFKLLLPEDAPDCCFPEYCVTDKGFTTKGYRVPVQVPAGATIPQPVAAIEGCAPPAMVCFHYCGPCLYVGYDAEPVIDPADPMAATGGGADPNPTCRDLIENGVCVETLYIHNPSAEDVLVTLSYYC